LLLVQVVLLQALQQNIKIQEIHQLHLDILHTVVVLVLDLELLVTLVVVAAVVFIQLQQVVRVVK
tara:strand:- start:145 stop:339 length:195 start_codon:yes stop_codon:yes gene_type:complete